MKLTPFGPNIWVADGPPVTALGPVTMPTRMIVVRLGDGSLWINSPIATSRAGMEQISKLGPVGHLVSPTPLHAWRLAEWAQYFTEARVWDWRGGRGDDWAQAWEADLDHVRFEGNLFISEVEFYHRQSKTLVLTDFVQNYPQRQRLFFDTMTRIAGIQGGGVPLDIRLSFLNRARARASLNALLRWDFERVILAHGDCVETNARAFICRAFQWLRRYTRACARASSAHTR